MSRYVDADALSEYVEKQYMGFIGNPTWDDINSAPSIDIVRCKECRYCKKKRGTFKGEPIIFYRCTENNRDVESDDYCSWGEREGE